MSDEKRRFDTAVVWNVASLAVLGVSGILLNYLIGKQYDEAALGVFNQALAAYIFFSQLAVGGINASTLRAIAEEQGNAKRIASIVLGAYAPTLVLATLTTVLLWFARFAIADWLDSPATAVGIAAITPGLFFFALNKVGMAVANGRQRMRAFAVYSALRYALILLALVGFLVLDPERARGNQIAFVFSFSEAVLFLVLLVEVVPVVRSSGREPWRGWAREHLRYGVKSAASGVLLELNARVDVLMIGHFMADRFVGIYTIAAMVAEGVYQLLVVLQNVYNPILARELGAKRFDALLATVKRGRRRTYAALAAVGVVAVLLYPHVVEFAFGGGTGATEQATAFAASWVPFCWLMLGIVLASGYIPFAQTLLMANRPGWHTLYMVLTVLINVIGNWILIPIWGLPGAALSTANSMFLSVFLLKALVRARTGLRL
ncbi:MAG: polysaccharide biosynthesis C-terminal domain-containing protein [Planctomycetes bacterium]|nr:polysaccharide biosynthesis C-terminal domain-containing protein [Planctomycetota bacterium]